MPMARSGNPARLDQVAFDPHERLIQARNRGGIRR